MTGVSLTLDFLGDNVSYVLNVPKAAFLRKKIVNMGKDCITLL